jgi:hypothetical protein
LVPKHGIDLYSLDSASASWIRVNDIMKAIYNGAGFQLPSKVASLEIGFIRLAQ